MELLDPEPALRTIDFLLYGLSPSWVGPRWVGGWGGPNLQAPDWEPPHPGPSQVTLGHGEPEAAPSLRVTAYHESSWLPPSELDYEIAEGLDLIGPISDYDYSGNPYEELRHLTADLDWEDIHVDVNGTPVRFRLLRHHGNWMAYPQNEGLHVWLDGRGNGGFSLEGLELVTISDATEYIEGTRAKWRSRGWTG